MSPTNLAFSRSCVARRFLTQRIRMPSCTARPPGRPQAWTSSVEGRARGSSLACTHGATSRQRGKRQKKQPGNSRETSSCSSSTDIHTSRPTISTVPGGHDWKYVREWCRNRIRRCFPDAATPNQTYTSKHTHMADA